MQYRPARTPGLLVGAALTGWALALALLLLAIGVGRELGFEGWLAYSASLAAAALAVLFGYWTWALWTLAYDLDRNALLIRWGWTQQVIPLGSIERLVPADAVGVARPRGVSWWGSQIGRATVEPIGRVLCYATGRLPERMVYVVTSEQSYALTIADPQDFARQVLIRQELGPTAQLQHHARRGGPPPLRTDDRIALLIAGLALLGGAAVWLQIALRQSAVPATVPLAPARRRGRGVHRAARADRAGRRRDRHPDRRSRDRAARACPRARGRAARLRGRGRGAGDLPRRDRDRHRLSRGGPDRNEDRE